MTTNMVVMYRVSALNRGDTPQILPVWKSIVDKTIMIKAVTKTTMRNVKP